MDVDWLIELEFFLEELDQLQRVPLRVRLRELAIRVARAGDDAARDVRLLPVQSHFHERLFHRPPRQESGRPSRAVIDSRAASRFRRGIDRASTYRADV